MMDRRQMLARALMAPAQAPVARREFAVDPAQRVAPGQASVGNATQHFVPLDTVDPTAQLALRMGIGQTVPETSRLYGMATDAAGFAATAPGGSRGGRRLQSVPRRSDEALAREYGMTIDDFIKMRQQNLAHNNRFSATADGLRDSAERMGMNARVEAPGDTSSRYLRVSDPRWGGQDVTVRIADHPQPTEYVSTPRGMVNMPVGGYSTELRARHPAADFSVDPATRYTEADALEFLRGLLLRGAAPATIAGAGAATQAEAANARP